MISRNFGMAALLLVTMFSAARTAGAQPKDPHVGYAHPAGGQQGTTFEIEIGGQHLDGVSGAHISGRGVHVEVLEHEKPLNNKQRNELREGLQQLKGKRKPYQEKGARKKDTGDEEKEEPAEEMERKPVMWRGVPLSELTRSELAELREKISNKKKQKNSQLAETVRLRVTLDPAVAAGDHELRLRTPSGLSNPLRFQVSPLPEVSEQEPNNDRASNQARSLPVVLNGQILPGDVDRFRFVAEKGQQLVASVSARALIPYLADAVPGWFQATLAIYDAAGDQLAFVDDYRFHPDPVLFFEVPESGEYELEIRDSIYRGREDFVYRVALGEIPFITSSFPLGGPAGQPTAVTLTGWNLARDRVLLGGETEPSDAALLAERIPFVTGNLPERREQEPNQDYENAEALELPMVINGRIEQPGDQDLFRFKGKKGDRLVAEVFARRLESPLDSVLMLTDSKGTQIEMNDDHDDRGAGLTTHQADSLLDVTLPATGEYVLHLRDAQAHGGEEYAYRLRVGPPQPDFALRVVPSCVNLRPGETVPLTVYALRRDGFDGEIQLELNGAPEGYALSGARIPAGQEQMRVTLTAPASEQQDEPFRLNVQGRAQVAGNDLVRAAVAADDLMQAFLYRHLVPAEEMLVAPKSRKGGRGLKLPTERLVGTKVKLAPGGTAEIVLPGGRRMPVDQLQFELNSPPEGITLKNVRKDRGQITLVLESDAEAVQPGLEGNLIVDLFLQRAAKQVPGKKQEKARRIALGSLPAIQFKVVRTREI